MKLTKTQKLIPSSFRDPSGFVFTLNGEVYRQINTVYQKNYDFLVESGLYKSLVDSKFLISHKEVINKKPVRPEECYKIIKPKPISFISYPYEWCFSELKDAALLTLKIQKIALGFGMCLKDASAYNVQFKNIRPIFIDTPSFEMYEEGKPWVAYRQFCENFLAPLALMSFKDVRLNRLLRIYLDGVPLDITSSLLPPKTWFKPGLLFHIHLHAKSQRHFASKTSRLESKHKISKAQLLKLIENLELLVGKLAWSPRGTEWADYYNMTNYSPIAAEHKQKIVAELLIKADPRSVWDLGGNTGLFNELLSDKGIETVVFDKDPVVIEKAYLAAKERKNTSTLPLILDLANPSPRLGWENTERLSLKDRGPADIVLALALIHHLAISHNLPFDKIAAFFSKICRFLIIEFIPKEDSNVQKLLFTREDIFPDYAEGNFKKEFSRYFTISSRAEIKDSKRTLYYMENKNNR